MDGRARDMLTRIQTGKGDQLTNILEGTQVTAFGHQLTGCQVANARNRCQQILLLLKARILVQVVGNGLFGLVNLLIQERQLGLQMFLNRGRLGCFLTVDDLLTAGRQILQMANERLQMPHFRCWRRPGRRMLGLTEVDNERGIQAIRLIAPQLALRVALDPRRVDHTHPIALLIQVLGDPFTVRPGRFQTGMHRTRRHPPTDPTVQFGKARRTVRKLLPVAAVTVPQFHIQTRFTHIDPQIAVHDFPSFWLNIPSARPTLYASSRPSPGRASDTVRLLDWLAGRDGTYLILKLSRFWVRSVSRLCLEPYPYHTRVR